MRRALAVGVCVVVLGIGGCGGDSDTDTASTTSSTTTDSASAPEPSRQSATKQDKGKQGKEADGSSAKGGGKDRDSFPQSATVKVPPISSAPVAGSTTPAPGVKTVKDGDNSVQTYGVEAEEAARTEAAIALQAYLDARRREDWESACSSLAQRPKAKLEGLAKQLQGQGKDLSGCAGAMAALGEGTPQSQRREEATISEVLSFRGGGDISGDPSYLIFEGPPGQTLYSMPMYLEADGWKVGLALPAELPV